jgi:hypothetical protein
MLVKLVSNLIAEGMVFAVYGSQHSNMSVSFTTASATASATNSSRQLPETTVAKATTNVAKKHEFESMLPKRFC